jgi:soluble lytic murein transglycosylase-like protein
MQTRCTFEVKRATRVVGMIAALLLFLGCGVEAFADRVLLKDGSTIEADEAWDDPQGVWYRQGGVTYLVERARVKSIEHAKASDAAVKIVAASLDETQTRAGVAADQPVTIYLTDGASFEVDEVTETDEGAWYKRGSLSIFIERARIARIEREKPVAGEDEAKIAAKHERHWTTGSSRLDQLIRQNGVRHGVDPYLIFLVMEQESHFNSRAVSPTGARGLMQLMPGTAARFGVRNSHDPAQNIAGGTRFLKQLLGRFNNRVDLVLASYNAGEGNVVKFGYRVPPFRETRNYVRKIGSRYGSNLSLAHATTAPEVKGDRAGAGTGEKRPRE